MIYYLGENRFQIYFLGEIRLWITGENRIGFYFLGENRFHHIFFEKKLISPSKTMVIGSLWCGEYSENIYFMIGIIMLHVGPKNSFSIFFFRALRDDTNIILYFSFNAWSTAKWGFMVCGMWVLRVKMMWHVGFEGKNVVGCGFWE